MFFKKGGISFEQFQAIQAQCEENSSFDVLISINHFLKTGINLLEFSFSILCNTKTDDPAQA